MQKRFILLLLIFLGILNLHAQKLRPGIDVQEIKELVSISERTCLPSGYPEDSLFTPPPTKYKMDYRSPELGLSNLWELWVSDDSVAVISIRGTSITIESWLANFYAAMVPAEGEITLSGKECFHYQLSNEPKAAVHVGWLISMGFLYDDMKPQLEKCYQSGIRDILITGHSQGGAIAYLLTAHLMNLRDKGEVPVDYTFKTYAIAAPKVGNLHFAYHFESRTLSGWTYNVVNSQDWVPEAPISIQTLDDFNSTNPFDFAKAIISNQKFPKNLILRSVYLQLEQPSKRAQKNYEKYLGDILAKEIEKKLIGLKVSHYYPSTYFVRTGISIPLIPGKEYFELYPEQSEDIFQHHHHKSYYFLLERMSWNE